MRPIGPRVRVVAQIVVGDQDDARAAVGHLAAVEPAQPALDHRVASSSASAMRVGHRPVPGLGVGVGAGVGEVQLGDGPQMRLVEAVAPVVLVGDSGEHVRPHELRVGCPRVRSTRRRPDAAAAVSPGTVFSSSTPTTSAVSYAPDRRSAIAARAATLPDAHAASWRDGRGVPQAVVTRGGHRAEVALTGEHLAEGVGDVDHLDRGGVDLGRGERGVDDLGGQVGEVQAFAGEVASEIALIAAEDPDVRGAAHDGRYYN